MELKANGVGGERAAREPRPSDRALAFLDPLLARPALVVEGDDVLGGARHVGDDKADARVKFARMPFDLGDDTAGFCPASGLIGEVRLRAPHFVRRTADRAVEEIADLSCKMRLAGRRIAYLMRSASRNS
jgi:hypothetical protein